MEERFLICTAHWCIQGFLTRPNNVIAWPVCGARRASPGGQKCRCPGEHLKGRHALVWQAEPGGKGEAVPQKHTLSMHHARLLCRGQEGNVATGGGDQSHIQRIASGQINTQHTTPPHALSVTPNNESKHSPSMMLQRWPFVTKWSSRAH